jgi:hypothetical protein
MKRAACRCPLEIDLPARPARRLNPVTMTRHANERRGRCGRGWPRLAGLVAGGWLALGLLDGGRALAADPPPPKPISYDDDDDTAAAPKMSPGEAAARRACSICHVYPDPSMLDRKHWQEQILPRMSVQLGVARPDYSSSPEGELIRERKIYPEQPRIPVEDWPLIEEFYLANAPEKPLPQIPHAPIELGLKYFEMEPPHFRLNPPTTTLVRISTNTHRLFVGDDHSKSLYILDAHGYPQCTIPLGNVPADLVETPEGIWVTCVGSFPPTEHYIAALLFLPRQGDTYGPPKTILKDLPRSTQAVFADFNGDGKTDFALCMFGNLTGRFSWFENLGNDQYREHVLSTKAGAIHAAVSDFNGDGKPDIAMLMAQETEMMTVLLNDGKGNFTAHNLWQKSAPWGHNTFQLVDFNRDGKMDFLVVNGDNGEFDSPLKYYHGIRLYENEGDLQFKETFFYPLNGAYGVAARDFTGTGRLDIAAISFFPDYVANPRESFVYLENEGNLKFKVTTFPQCISGRWIVMDAGDLDGDGKDDIVLGSYIYGPTPGPQFLVNIWKTQGPSVLILHNTSPR